MESILAIDIGSTSVTAVVAKNDYDSKINILGTGISQSRGISKGLITNIDLAAEAIESAVLAAKRSSADPVDSAVVSLSSNGTKGIRGSGSINIPNGIITENEIKLSLETALYNTNIVPDFDVIHVVPIYFKVDDGSEIYNPLNMNGSRLEVEVYIVTAKKTVLTNIKNALKKSRLEIDNFILTGYASATSVLDDDQKNLGVGVIDIGGSTTDISICKDNALIYSEFLPIGSENITNDLSIMLHTPAIAAEMIKNQYGTVIPIDESGFHGIKKIKVPIIGDEDNSKELTLDTIITIIHARIEETLILIKEKLESSSLLEACNAGIVITGGMSRLPGIKELAAKIFEGHPIKVANPVNIKNGYLSFDDPSMATIVGLLLYSLDTNPNFELDSNKKLRKKRITPKRTENRVQPVSKQQEQVVAQPKTQARQQSKSGLEETLLPKLDKKDKKPMSKFWNKVSEWF